VTSTSLSSNPVSNYASPCNLIIEPIEPEVLSQEKVKSFLLIKSTRFLCARLPSRSNKLLRRGADNNWQTWQQQRQTRLTP
jgi:hypothetical protein